jgi:DNA-binding GntR family transcriptional regulator
MIPHPPWFMPVRRVFATYEPHRESVAIATSRSTAVKLHRQIALHFEMRIATGRWRPGFRLPPEPVIAKKLGVNRNTVRAAINALASKGLLRHRPGGGTFVELLPLDSFERHLDDPRWPLYQMVVQSDLEQDDIEVAEVLQLPADTPIPHIRRTRCQCPPPTVVVDSYFPPSVWNALDADAQAEILETRWDDDVYRDDPGIRIAVADEFVAFGRAKPHEIELMALHKDALVVRIDRIGYDRAGKPLEFRRIASAPNQLLYFRRVTRFELEPPNEEDDIDDE